jgi:hypothetical protein
VVEPHHLLLVRDDARLLRRPPLARREDAGRRRARLLERAPQPVARRVAADETARRGPAAERAHVADDVARTARPQLLARDVNDGHRRLGGDAVDLSEHELIEHQVADDEHADAREAPEKGPQPLLAHAHGGPP